MRENNYIVERPRAAGALRHIAPYFIVVGAFMCLALVIYGPIRYPKQLGSDNRGTIEVSYFWSQIFIMLAVLIGIAFAIQEISRSRMSTEATLFEATADRIRELSRLMAENSDVIPLLRTSQKLDRAQTDRTELISLANLDTFDTERLKSASYPQLVSRFPATRRWILETLQEYPRMRQVLRHRREWYSYGLYSLAERARRSEIVDVGHTAAWLHLTHNRLQQIPWHLRKRYKSGPWGMLPGDIVIKLSPAGDLLAYWVTAEVDEKFTQDWDLPVYRCKAAKKHNEIMPRSVRISPANAVVADVRKWRQLLTTDVSS